MKVSILIPAHNEELYIQDTIRAALAQTHSDTEVIVIDNNSSDATVNKIKEFPSVKLVLEPRPGVQFAREAGRKAATGDIIANLDADCRPKPNWIETALRYFDSPNVVAVTGYYDFYDAGPVFRTLSRWSQKITFTIVHFLVDKFFTRGVMMTGGNAVIRASALEKIGGYNTEIKFFGDDIDTGNRLAAIGKVLHPNDIVVGSSARRFKKQGIIKTLWEYNINYIWVVLFHKPFQNKFGNK